MSEFDASQFLSQAPARPGVYRMYDQAGELLYVGKAKHLKKRLSSYFRKTGLDSKTMALVSRIHHIDTTITSTETEALLLEQNLIKQHRPPYNILLRDDKSYAYIFLSSQDDFPRLTLHRGRQRQRGQYFGPYPSAGAVRESLALLQKMFRVRQCEDSYFSNRSRPCLQYQIKRCSGPCVGLVSKDAYAEDVRHSVMFLQGRNELIADELNRRMEHLSEAQRFEEAAQVRDQIRDIRAVQERQYVTGEKGDVDVLALVSDAGMVCIHVLYIRGGRLLGNKSYYPRFVLNETGADVLHAFIAQYYLTEQQRSNIPRELVLSETPSDADTLGEALSLFSERQVSLKTRVRGHRQKWKDMALTNAQHALMTRLNSRQSMEKRFAALQLVLGMEAPPGRLECFDISHSAGEATVASCVVFDSQGPMKSDYRRFNIDGITPGDDYAAMEQALTRRYKRLVNGEGKLPDLLLIDGGKGQLRQAEQVLEGLGVSGVQVMGIAKGISRRAGQETLFLAGSHEELVLDADAPALHLLQHIRDEAHRFAITAHRQRRGKKRTESFLDDIPGIGPKKRRDLIRYFGGQQEIKRASVEDLQRVNGISKALADTIYDHIHR